MMKRLLLDLYCCAGGAARGYQQAGFYVVGVDIKPQPHYIGDEFFQCDALDFVARYGKDFYAIHASPPCQAYSTMTRGLWQETDHPKLIPSTRQLLQASGKHWIIENVEGARKELITPTLLCGTMFGLETEAGNQLQRHRYFETSFSLGLTHPCSHNKKQSVGVYGHAGGKSKRDGLTMFNTEVWREVMQIDWMNGAELAEAIPPAYTKWIGDRIPKIGD